MWKEIERPSLNYRPTQNFTMVYSVHEESVLRNVLEDLFYILYISNEDSQE